MKCDEFVHKKEVKPLIANERSKLSLMTDPERLRKIIRIEQMRKDFNEKTSTIERYTGRKCN